MIKHTLFLRWWLIVVLTGVGSYFAGRFGAFGEIYEKDVTKLSFVIITGFVFMSAWCGIKTFSLSRAAGGDAGSVPAGQAALLDRIANLEEVGWFAAGTFTSIGMIGTVIGMIWALRGFIGVSITEISSVQRLISEMVFGVSTALYTTLVGLICSTLLKVQYFNLGHWRRKISP